MADNEIISQIAEFEDKVEDVKSSSGGLAFELVLEAPKIEEPDALADKLTHSGASSPRDKNEVEAKLARAEERRKEYLESKVESARTVEERRSEVLTKQKEEEQKFIEQTKKKLEEEFNQISQNKENRRQSFIQQCQEKNSKIEEAQRRAADNVQTTTAWLGEQGPL